MRNIKLILITLLTSTNILGQAVFDEGIQNTAAATALVPNYVVTQGASGLYGKIEPIDLIVSQATLDSLSKKPNLNTGSISGLNLSINVDNTKFDLSPGVYAILEYSNYINLTDPMVKIKTYAGATGVTPAFLGSSNATYLAIDVNMNIIQKPAPFTSAERRFLAVVGSVIHSNFTNINLTNEIKAPSVGGTNQLHDFIRAIGPFNILGNVYSPNGANLNINKSAGTLFSLGINGADYLNPHELTIPAQTALTFRYRSRVGAETADTQNINPNLYDNLATITAVPPNKWTVQRINLFQSGATRIQYGQNVFNSFAEAVSGYPTVPFTTETNIAENAIFRAYLVIKEGTTDISASITAGEARFIPVDKFGNAISGGAIALTYATIVSALGYVPANDVSVIHTSGNETRSGSLTSDKFIKSGTPSNNVLLAGGDALSQNTAFNKNFGTIAGTVTEGNDSRLTNGQTAFGWGNHAGLYPLYDGTGANGTWNVGITGLAALNLPLTGGTLSGNLTAQSFIKSGGLSSEFLKADGSSDNTEYNPKLFSGTNIKTINGTSVLGSGNLIIKENIRSVHLFHPSWALSVDGTWRSWNRNTSTMLTQDANADAGSGSVPDDGINAGTTLISMNFITVPDVTKLNKLTLSIRHTLTTSTIELFVRSFTIPNGVSAIGQETNYQTLIHETFTTGGSDRNYLKNNFTIANHSLTGVTGVQIAYRRVGGSSTTPRGINLIFDFE